MEKKMENEMEAGIIDHSRMEVFVCIEMEKDKGNECEFQDGTSAKGA